jgi:hypothetical protein
MTDNKYKPQQFSTQIDELYSYLDSQWYGLSEANPCGEMSIPLDGVKINIIQEALCCLSAQYKENEATRIRDDL